MYMISRVPEREEGVRVGVTAEIYCGLTGRELGRPGPLHEAHHHHQHQAHGHHSGLHQSLSGQHCDLWNTPPGYSDSADARNFRFHGSWIFMSKLQAESEWCTEVGELIMFSVISWHGTWYIHFNVGCNFSNARSVWTFVKICTEWSGNPGSGTSFCFLFDTLHASCHQPGSIWGLGRANNGPPEIWSLGRAWLYYWVSSQTRTKFQKENFIPFFFCQHSSIFCFYIRCLLQLYHCFQQNLNGLKMEPWYH